MANAHNGLLISPDETTQGESSQSELTQCDSLRRNLNQGIDGQREHANLSSD